MLNNLNVFSAATGLSRHAAQQQALVADNLANIDTPGFRSIEVESFKVSEEGALAGGDLRRSRPTHFSSFDDRSEAQVSQNDIANLKPNGNSVSLEMETLKSIEAERMHSRAMAVYQSSLNILRSSMGRGR